MQLTRTYVDYLFANFPLGSLEMRPINISEPSAVLDARQQSLLRLFQTFPKRKFVLVGDTSSSTLLSAYPQIATQFPDQLACILVRNTSATDADDKLPYNTKDFQNVSSSRYFFYTRAEGASPPLPLRSFCIHVLLTGTAGPRSVQPGHRERAVREQLDPAERQLRRAGRRAWPQRGRPRGRRRVGVGMGGSGRGGDRGGVAVSRLQ